MAVITSASSGNFSAPATWVGGVVPGAGDDAVAATTHVVTIDVDVTVISFQQAGTGRFVLGNGRTVTGNVIANAGTFTSGGTIEVTATTTAVINGNLTGVSTTVASIAGVVISGTGALTINGSVSGSAGNATSNANSNSAIYTNVTCTLNINGAVSGGPGQYKRAITTGALSSATVTITGNLGTAVLAGTIDSAGPNVSITVFGNMTANSNLGQINTSGANTIINVAGNLTASGSNTQNIVTTGAGTQVIVTGNLSPTTGTNVGGILQITGTPQTATVTGNIFGGTGAGSHAIVQYVGTGNVYFTGTAIAGGAGGGTCIYGSGGSSTVSVIGSTVAGLALHHAVRSDATVNGVIFQGDMTDATDGTVAVWCRVFRLTQTTGGVTKYASGPNNPFGTLVSRVDPGNTTGMPVIANVRNGTMYGDVNQFTGTLAMPSAGQTMYGVPVDGTTGTAVFDLQQVADIVELQVSAGAYERTTL